MDAGRLRWVIVLSIVGALGVSACSTDSPTPATAPATTATTVLETSTTTTSEAPATTTSTTAAPPTTVNRKAEIEAIFQDLEQRRLTALYEGDEEAFRALFANEAYLERSMEALDLATFASRPTDVKITVEKVLADTGDCATLRVTRDFTSFLGSEAVATSTVVIESVAKTWGYSYETEENPGWTCEGEHPLRQ